MSSPSLPPITSVSAAHTGKRERSEANTAPTDVRDQSFVRVTDQGGRNSHGIFEARQLPLSLYIPVLVQFNFFEEFMVL